MLPKVSRKSPFVNLRFQSEYRKIRTRNNSVFGHFSRSTYYPKLPFITLYFTILGKFKSNFFRSFYRVLTTWYNVPWASSSHFSVSRSLNFLVDSCRQLRTANRNKILCFLASTDRSWAKTSSRSFSIFWLNLKFLNVVWVNNYSPMFNVLSGKKKSCWQQNLSMSLNVWSK